MLEIRKRLRNRIEQILDVGDELGGGATTDVIIQARRPDGPMQEIASKAALAMRERMYSRSAREVIPPKKSDRDALRRMSEADAKHRIIEVRSSMFAQIARAPGLLATTSLPTRKDLLGAIWLPRYRKLMADPTIPVNRDDFPVVEYHFRGFESAGGFAANYPMDEFGRVYTKERYERTRRRGAREAPDG